MANFFFVSFSNQIIGKLLYSDNFFVISLLKCLIEIQFAGYIDRVSRERISCVHIFAAGKGHFLFHRDEGKTNSA